MYQELLIGCGFARDKRISPYFYFPNLLEENIANMVADGYDMGKHDRKEWQNLTTLDVNPDCNPDVCFDLNDAEGLKLLAKFKEQPMWQFDEIHAYEVVEHLGRQGDVKSFFAFFNAMHALLKPGGFFICTCPSRNSPWLWGDPGHTRAIVPESLSFLVRNAQLYKTLHLGPASDYRSLITSDFDIAYANDDKKQSFMFMLMAVKPVREWP